jgi:hypothetical protein
MDCNCLTVPFQGCELKNKDMFIKYYYTLFCPLFSGYRLAEPSNPLEREIVQMIGFLKRFVQILHRKKCIDCPCTSGDEIEPPLFMILVLC